MDAAHADDTHPNTTHFTAWRQHGSAWRQRLARRSPSAKTGCRTGSIPVNATGSVRTATAGHGRRTMINRRAVIIGRRMMVGWRMVITWLLVNDDRPVRPGAAGTVDARGAGCRIALRR